MSRRVLIVEPQPTGRIALKAALAAARYEVVAVATGRAALEALSRDGADLVVASAQMSDIAVDIFCRNVALTVEDAPPIMVIAGAHDPAERVEWLAAGAEVILDPPIDRNWLLARARALIRAHQGRTELRRRNATARRLGFAETPDPFIRHARVVFVSDDPAQGASLMQTLGPHMAVPARLIGPDALLGALDGPEPPDVALLAPAGVTSDGLLWLVSEICSRPKARRVAVVVMVAAGDWRQGAMALDIGASDVVFLDAQPLEMARRLSRVLSRKIADERLRTNLEAGLALAARDELTGLWNRRYAMQHLDLLAQRPHARGRGYGVILVDVDRFKSVNDRHGHLAGDDVLIGLSERVSQNLRDFDLVARMGGEEFLVALSDTAPDEALRAAERLRAAVEGAPFDTVAGPISATVSLGVVCAAGAAPSAMLRSADLALYKAKHRGRNRVAVGDPVPGRSTEGGAGAGPEPASGGDDPTGAGWVRAGGRAQP